MCPDPKLAPVRHLETRPSSSQPKIFADDPRIAENENANGDRVFIEIPPADRAGVEKGFDEVVLWRTQDMIFAEQGKSCSLP